MKVYEKLYNEGSVPMPDELIGIWGVTILSGSLPDMHRLGPIKVIEARDNSLRGYNRTLRFFKWGKFKIGFSEDCAMFMYGKIPFFDKVRKVSSDLLVGQYRLMGELGKFEVAGYFKMVRK